MVGGQGNLVEAHRIHEVEIGTVVVQILHLTGFQTHSVELRAGVERVVDHTTGLDVAKLRADEGAALAGLDMLELDDGAHLAVVDDAHSVLEIGGRDSHVILSTVQATKAAPLVQPLKYNHVMRRLRENLESRFGNHAEIL